MGLLAAYLGPRAHLAQLLEGGADSLVKQAVLQPASFGVSWYPEDGAPSPVSLLSREPLTASHPHLALLRRYQAEVALAALGSGAPQPLAHGRHAFVYEGDLARFEEVFARRLRERLGDEAFALAEGRGAAGLLFATWVDALGTSEGPEAMATALERMVEVVQQVGQERDAAASFAVVVTDGSSLVTLRTATAGVAPPLYTLVAEEGAPWPASGRLVASAPLFPGPWVALEPHSLVIFTVEPEAADEAPASHGPGDGAR
jgi:hypothetical protein